MSRPQRGLGRGLESLLPRNPTGTGGVTQIAVDRIRPNRQQPRTHFDPDALHELGQSIREVGILVPVIVRSGAEAGMYELIAGERRWRAAAAVGLATVPAIVREADDRASLELAVVENLQRSDLDPLEEAAGFAHLIDEYGFTQEQLAERLGKGRPTVANGLRLLALSDSIKAEIRAGRLSGGHGRALLAFPEGDREGVAKRAIRDDLRVRDLERLAAEHRRSPQASPVARTSSPARPSEFEAAEEQLRFRLGTRAAIVPAARGGRIEIRYADGDDLTRLVELLLGGKP
jgi:ParB family chromosome partitioning protein